MPTKGSCNCPFGDHRTVASHRLPHTTVLITRPQTGTKSTATPLCYLHLHRKIQQSQTDSLLPPSDRDDVMVVNSKCRWTADRRLHTITDLKSESADGSGLKIRFSAHRINDRRQSLLSPTAPAAHSEDVRSPKRQREASASHAGMRSIHCSASVAKANSRIECVTNENENEHLIR